MGVCSEPSIRLGEQKPNRQQKAAHGRLLCFEKGRLQVEKLDPQPQVVVAFGFLITNCAPCKSSL